MTTEQTMRESRDGQAMLADGIGDGQIRVEAAWAGSISITVQPARNCLASQIRITREDALALAAELTKLAERA